MMKKMIVAVLGFVVLCLIGWFFAAILMSLEDNRAWGAEAGHGLKTGDYHWIAPTGIPYGNPNASVVIVEFSDFQCPFCKIASGDLKEAVDESGGRAMIVFRHFPLPFHSLAKPAAYAVVAAGRQGNFWTMAEKLFADKSLDKDAFVKHATELNLDLKKFKEDLSATATVAEVERDFKEAIGLGLNAAPTFFFNGRVHVGAASKEKFAELIKTAYNELEKLKAPTVCGLAGCIDGDVDAEVEETEAETETALDGDIDSEAEMVEEETKVVDGDLDSEAEEISATEVANFFIPGVATIINVAEKIATTDGDVDAEVEETADGDVDFEAPAFGEQVEEVVATISQDGDLDVLPSEDGDTETSEEHEITPVASKAVEAKDVNSDQVAVENKEVSNFYKNTLIVGFFDFIGFALGEVEFNPATEENSKVLQEIRTACANECYAELIGQADKSEIRGAGKILQANAQTVLGLRRANNVRSFLLASQLPVVAYSPIGEWGDARRVRVIIRKASTSVPFGIGGGNTADNVSGQGGGLPPKVTATASDNSGMESMTKIITAPREPIFGIGAFVSGRCGFTGCNAGGGVQMDFYIAKQTTLRFEGSLSAPFVDRPHGGFNPNTPSHQLGFQIGTEITYQPKKWLEVGGGVAFTEGYAFPKSHFSAWRPTWYEWELTVPVYFQVWEKNGQALSLFVRPAVGVAVWGPESRLFLPTPSGTIGICWRFGRW